MGVRLKVGGNLSALDLRKLARKEGDGKVVGRLLAIASALDGLTREQAAKQAGMDRQILADWVHRYNEGGVEGLRDKPKGARQATFDARTRDRDQGARTGWTRS